MAEIDATALTALIISLVALVVAVGQILQQYVATADGYRRCLPSVMGQWGTKSERRWRFMEFRFETIYYVPSISVGPPGVVVADSKSISELRQKDWRKIDLSNSTYTLKSIEPLINDTEEHKRKYGDYGAMVCWVAFLERLYERQKEIEDAFEWWWPAPESKDFQRHVNTMPTIPCVRILRRSWDFMPPEVVRPLCETTISDIALLVLRLGMSWKEFNPANRKLRAEGPGSLITSRYVPSVGLCLEYITTGYAKVSKEPIRPTTDRPKAAGIQGDPAPDQVGPVIEVNSKTNKSRATISSYQSKSTRESPSLGPVLLNSFLPVDGVSYFLFGIVPGNDSLSCFSRPLGTLNEIKEFLDFLDSTAEKSSNLPGLLVEAMKHREGWIPGFNDIIPITAPKLGRKSSPLCNLPMPNTYSAGVLRTEEGLFTFCERLKEYVEEHPSKQLKSIQDFVEKLEKHIEWKANDSVWASISPAEHISPQEAYNARKGFHVLVHDALDEAEKHLRLINVDPHGSIHNHKTELKHGFCYDTLVVEHLRMSITSYKTAMYNMDKTPMPKHWKGMDKGRSWLSACMNQYWDELEELAKSVEKITVPPDRIRVEPDYRLLVVDAWVTMIFRAFCWHHCHRLVAVKIVLPSEWHGSRMPVYIG
ncbi:hypothetical protein N656DRAFT_69871 [Canariomyces notabilis]|uniref:Uncharacterized protein n=1 Tax=Canariomyces notabilis TaxID=2074819 RepID=A0AAN6TEK7_9PEZI|nr:hypothetical protein N656DRAFT_69871 [Canariomyces arenarius]